MKVTINAEKVAAIDAARTETPRDPVAELDALKAVLAKKNVVSDTELEEENDAIARATREMLDATDEAMKQG